MPKLQIFVPCERVIIGQENSASVILIMAEVTFSDLPAQLPDHPASPSKWHVFSQWLREPGDEGNLFWQEIKMVDGDGKLVILPHSASFKISADIHRMNAMYEVFPIIPPGPYDLVLSLREDSQGTYSEVGRYTLRVYHRKEDPETQKTD